MPSSLLIACLSQKGGVGKSTLSRLVARTYAAAGWKVKIGDFNPKQKTSVDWVATRQAQGLEPEIAAESFTSVKTALRQEWDLMVFDGRPDSDTSTLEIAREAHLVLIPSGVTLDDLKPQSLFAHELVARGVSKHKLMFALNRTNESLIATNDARRYLATSGLPVAVNELPDRVGYQIAQNSGRACSETTFTSLNEKAEALATEFVKRATQLQGK
jgi:chromosome partitioning protein